MVVTIQFSWLDPERSRDLCLPRYQTAQAAGLDICAATEGELVIRPGMIVLVPTGFSVAIPEGYEMQVRPRSGLAVRHGITVINSPGTIDADYRGEIRVALMNLGTEPFVLHRGDRIAQLVLAPVMKAQFELVQELDTTDRGVGGFGHTGRQ